MNKNPVVHFEMGYEDQDRMVNFYTKVFGWGAKPMGPEMGNYIVVQTTETDEAGMVKTPGAINGGFYQKNADPLSQSPSVVVSVQDIKQSIEAIVANGGKVLGAMDKDGNRSLEPVMIPGVGLWVSVMDTEGNRFSVLQSKM